jgi:hypothetical protein
MRGTRFGLVGFAVALVLGAALPALASAGALSVTPGSTYVSPLVSFTAAGERNDLVIGSYWDFVSRPDPSLPPIAVVAAPGAIIFDRTNEITGDCVALRPQVRFCPDFVVSLNPSRRGNRYDLQLGDGDDRVQVLGTFLGAVNVDAGSGNDVVWSRNVNTESIVCGSGFDVVVADQGGFGQPIDAVSSDCEIVNPPDSWLVDITLNVGGEKRHVRAIRCDKLDTLRQYPLTLVPCPLIVFGH